MTQYGATHGGISRSRTITFDSFFSSSRQLCTHCSIRHCALSGTYDAYQIASSTDDSNTSTTDLTTEIPVTCDRYRPLGASLRQTNPLLEVLPVPLLSTLSILATGTLHSWRSLSHIASPLAAHRFHLVNIDGDSSLTRIIVTTEILFLRISASISTAHWCLLELLPAPTEASLGIVATEKVFP